MGGAFERGQVLTSADLNWYLTVGDTLTDAYEIGYQIWNIIGDPTGGTQIFPETADTWEEVTTTGKFATGCYYTYDSNTSTGWQVPADAAVGAYRVKWRWKAAENSSYLYGQEDFSVVLESGGTSPYIDVQDVRDAGLESSVASDSEVLAAILLWQEVLNRACRQWFLPKQLTFNFDGNDRDTIFLGVPAITVDYLKINSQTDELDTDLYRVYNSREYPDDRRNPRIKLLHSAQLTDIYVAPSVSGERRFLRGHNNQEISGTFGFTEPDDTTPLAIKRALLKLVIEKLSRPLYTPAGSVAPAPSTTVAGVILSEKTDGHSISYGTAEYTNRRTGGISGITQDSEILDIIKLYRAPIGIANTSAWSHYG